MENSWTGACITREGWSPEALRIPMHWEAPSQGAFYFGGPKGELQNLRKLDKART